MPFPIKLLQWSSLFSLAAQRCTTCHQNATCSTDRETRKTKCICRVGFVGNGTHCSPILEIVKIQDEVSSPATSAKNLIKTTETIDLDKDDISKDVHGGLDIAPQKGKQITKQFKGK